MKQALLIVLDSVGMGACPDAGKYVNGNTPDTGADTLGHCLQWAISSGIPPNTILPNLRRWGLIDAYNRLHGSNPILSPIRTVATVPVADWGYARMQAIGKDTTTGHWEICGYIINNSWHVFPDSIPSVPLHFLDQLEKTAQVSGFLGNRRASGTEIIRSLGREHIESGKPIAYTSADSVLQIAAHEEAFGLERLYDLCQKARKLWDSGNNAILGRVIARPFLGRNPDHFLRTGNRRDFAIPPPPQALLNHLCRHEVKTECIGKIRDIFAGHGVMKHTPAGSNTDVAHAITDHLHETLEQPRFIFANMNDFDSLFGHRRNVKGYFEALQAFDTYLPQLESHPSSLIILCADHGNDPTWVGTDHTRERVPILCHTSMSKGRFIGERSSLADIGQTLCSYFNTPPLPTGSSFL